LFFYCQRRTTCPDRGSCIRSHASMGQFPTSEWWLFNPITGSRPLVSPSGRQFQWIGGVAQAYFGETQSGGIVEQDAIFFPHPQVVGLQLSAAVSREGLLAVPKVTPLHGSCGFPGCRCPVEGKCQ